MVQVPRQGTAHTQACARAHVHRVSRGPFSTPPHPPLARLPHCVILAKTCALHSRSCLFSRVRRAGLAGSPCAPVSPVGTSAAALDGGRRFVTGLGLQCKPSELMLHLYAVLNEKRIRWRKVNAYRAVYPRYHTGCILRPAPYSLASLPSRISPLRHHSSCFVSEMCTFLMRPHSHGLRCVAPLDGAAGGTEGTDVCLNKFALQVYKTGGGQNCLDFRWLAGDIPTFLELGAQIVSRLQPSAASS
jgi:hypothetical protein